MSVSVATTSMMMKVSEKNVRIFEMEKMEKRLSDSSGVKRKDNSNLSDLLKIVFEIAMMVEGVQEIEGNKTRLIQ